MNRIVIERQDLYDLLDEQLREYRQSAGCQVCRTPFPFYCDSSDGGANWRVASLPACEKSCRTVLAGIVKEIAQRYQLSRPLWRTYHRQHAATATGD